MRDTLYDHAARPWILVMLACAPAIVACGSAGAGAPPRSDLRQTKAQPAPAAASATAPVAAAETGPPIAARRIAMAPNRACAVLVDGTVACWGGVRGSTPQRVPGIRDATDVVVVGDEVSILRASGTIATAGLRVPAFEPIRDARAVASEYFARCVVRRSGEVLCGNTYDAQLRAVAGVRGATAVAVGRAHGCAVADRGRVLCWKNPNPGARTTATPVAGLEGATEVSVGAVVGCARGPGSHVGCFELDGVARKAHAVGVADAIAVTDWFDGSPSPIVCRAQADQAECMAAVIERGSLTLQPGRLRGQAGASITQLAVSYASMCTLDEAGEVRCLGANTEGVLGTPHPTIVETPTPVVGMPPLRSVSAGSSWVCGLGNGGQVWCAGEQMPARPVAGLAGVARLVGDNSYACALRSNGEATCAFVTNDAVHAAERVPAFDGARDLALPMLGFQQPVGVITSAGELAVGTTDSFDSLQKLRLARVPRLRDLQRVVIGLQLQRKDAPGYVARVRALDAGGRVWELSLVDGAPRGASKHLSNLDGAVAINDGFTLKANGELWRSDEDKEDELVRARSGLVALVARGPCGPTAQGALQCVEIHPAVAEAPADRTVFSAATAVAEHDGRYHALDAKGALYCAGYDIRHLCAGTGIESSSTFRPVTLRAAAR